MQEKSWFDMLFSKYIPFMVRERFKADPKPLKIAEIERFPGL